MSRRFKILFMLAVVILQATVLAHFTPFSVLPNFTLVSLLTICIIYPSDENIALAVGTGLLTDFISGAILGIATLLFMYAVILCNVVTETIFGKRVFVFAPLTFVISFIYELIFGVFSYLVRGVSFAFEAVYKTVLPVALLNTLIFIFLYLVLSRIKFEKKRKGIRYEQ